MGFSGFLWGVLRCRYDKMSARELCRMWGVSDVMYERFLKPTLLVGLFAPPEVCCGIYGAFMRGCRDGVLHVAQESPNAIQLLLMHGCKL